MAKITLENGMVLEGTPEELVELSKGFEAEEKPVYIEEPKPVPFEVGDYVKVAGNAVFIKVGDIAKITNVGGHYDFIITRLSDGKREPIDTDYIVKATEEEIAEATKLETQFKVGDYVKAVKSNSGHVGKIFVVTKVFTQPEMYNGITYTFEAKSVDERDIYTAYSNDDRSVLATEEEVAAAKAEIEATSKWAKIGRKPNEYKVGDVIGYKFSKNDETISYVIKRIEGIELWFYCDDEKEDMFIRKDSETIQFIMPVEARFDR
jgi:hypothetical protein